MYGNFVEKLYSTSKKMILQKPSIVSAKIPTRRIMNKLYNIIMQVSSSSSQL